MQNAAPEIRPENRLSTFRRDGYICVDPLFDQSEMTELNREITRFIRDVVPTMPAAQVYYEDKSDRTSLKQLQRMFQHDAYFGDLMNNGPVRRIAEEVLQDEVVPVNMQYFNKPAGIGQATPPHQDGFYFHLSPVKRLRVGWRWKMSTMKMAASTMYAAPTNGKSFGLTDKPAFLAFLRA